MTNSEDVQQYIRSSFRKLYGGSNCIVIERGIVPRYTECIGCVNEVALSCLNDMRTNISSNVGIGCNFNYALSESYNQACCPQFAYELATGATNLIQVGSAYPETLRCLAKSGCQDSRFYTQLLQECESTCPSSKFVDQFGGSVCLANFNSASKLIFNYKQLLLLVLILSSTFVMM